MLDEFAKIFVINVIDSLIQVKYYPRHVTNDPFNKHIEFVHKTIGLQPDKPLYVLCLGQNVFK